MFCSNCGIELSKGAKFCSNCGSAVDISKEKTTHDVKVIQLRCKSCNGIMDVEADNLLLVCPFCGSKELIVEDKDVVIERLWSRVEQEKQQIYRDVELKKIKREAEKEKHQEEQARLQKFKEGKLNKVILVFIVLCLLIGVINFSTRRFLQGCIAFFQAILLIVSWLQGMHFIKEKRKDIHLFFVMTAFLLFIPLIWLPGNKDADTTFSSGNKGTDTTSSTVDYSQENATYVYRIRNYVGRNLASFGQVYRSYRVDEYGAANLKLCFVTDNGVYIDPENDEQLKQYVVVEQNLSENTEITVVHLRDSKGKPYSNLVDWQSYEEIVLQVVKVGEETPVGNASLSLTTLMPANKYSIFIKDYVGRNLAACGELSGDKLCDEYGVASLTIVIVTEDGSFVNPENKQELQNYVVISQGIEPNTKVDLVFMKDSKGEEYHNLIQSQTYEEIELYVRKIN